MTRRRIATDAKIAVAYLRVSTDEQHLGPEAQRTAIEAWADRAGVTVAAWHADRGLSGASPIDKRPGLLAAIEDLRTHGAGVLVVAKRDRLARDVVIAATIERLAQRCGAVVTSADGVGAGDGPESALMRTLVDAFAQYERALIRARTKVALAAKSRRGERVGGVPIGQRLVEGDPSRVEADPAEAKVVAFVMRARGRGRTYRQIADALLAKGHRPRGQAWHVTTLRRMVARASAP